MIFKFKLPDIYIEVDEADDDGSPIGYCFEEMFDIAHERFHDMLRDGELNERILDELSWDSIGA